MKTTLKSKLCVSFANIFLTSLSVAVSFISAEFLCDLTVEKYSVGRFASYLYVITDEVFLFAFLYFAFDGVFGILRLHGVFAKKLFLQSRKSEVTLFRELPRVLFSLEFLAECAVFAAACLLSPRFGTPHLALLASVCAFRKAAVRRKWYITRNKPRRGNIFISIFKSLSSLVFQFALALYLLPFAFPFLWVFFMKWEVITASAISIFLGFSVYIHARAARKRRELLERLSKLCLEKGFELSEIKHKYSFIFGRNAGANFTVCAHGKTYACKFIASKIFGVPIIFKNGGEGNFHYIFKIRGAPLINKRAYFEYGFEAGEKERKLLICSPLPISMSMEENGRATQISSGAELWEYKIFGASNFLRCLEFDVIER